MDTKKICCPHCSQFFQLKPSNSKSIPTIPLFLACGHTVCERCIRNLLRFGEPINCKICQQDMQVSTSDAAVLMQNKISFHELFPINVYMVGELTLQDIEPKEAKKEERGRNVYLDIASLIKETESNLCECMECHGPTPKMCQQCNITICESCFHKTHTYFAIFKSHSLCKIIDVTSKKNTCTIHKDKPLDHYCKECRKSICMDCMVACENHNVIPIKEAIADVKRMKNEIDEKLKRLTKTAVQIGNSLTKIDDDLTSSKYTIELGKIEQHFSKINQIIQKHKDEITSKLFEVKKIEKESLEEAKSHVAEAIKKAKSTLDAVTSLDSDETIESNITALIDDVKDIIDTPWCVKYNAESKMNVSAKEDLYTSLNDLISKGIQLKGDLKPKYKLYTTTELTEKNEDIPAAPNSIVYPPQLVQDVRFRNKQKPKEDVTETIKVVKLPDMNRSRSDEQPQVEPAMPPRESEHPNQLCEGSQEVVYISHVEDPHAIYVHRVSQLHKLEELQRELRNPIARRPAISNVTPGKVYLVYNKADKLWERGRVLRVETKHEFRVFRIDYGGTTVATVNELRCLPPARITSPPPLAVKCCLANCEPINDSWTSDDSTLIQNIVNNERAVVRVRHVRATAHGEVLLVCDIATYVDGVNIAQALAFHGHARIPHIVPYPQMLSIKENTKINVTNIDFKLNSKQQVCITHIVGPDSFFVRKWDYQDQFGFLCQQLQQRYNRDDNEFIYLPEKDMACVAQVEKRYLGARVMGAPQTETAWARAVVQQLQGRGRVELLLPDVGARVVVPWSALRRMHAKLAEFNALATECYLAGVIPPTEEWSPQSVVFLKTFKNKVLTMDVEVVNPESLGVALYCNGGNINCINVTLIQQKLAIAYGDYMFTKNTVYDKESPSEQREPSEPEHGHESARASTNAPERRPTETAPSRVEAKILTYQSPELIYVTFVHRQKGLDKLFDNIQRYYSRERRGRRDWRPAEPCCVRTVDGWWRAVVTAVEGDRATVFYTDHGCAETLPLADLRDLPPRLAIARAGAVACRLAGVRPAAGAAWPADVGPYLGRVLDTDERVFVTEVGEFDGNSVPVEMWVCQTTQGAALEPSCEWRCLNRMIIDDGLGLPDNGQ